MSGRTCIYRSSLLTLLMFFSYSAAAEEPQDPPANGGAAPADPSTPPVKISNEVVGSSTTLRNPWRITDPGHSSATLWMIRSTYGLVRRGLVVAI
jgi:hypothetical protein